MRKLPFRRTLVGISAAAGFAAATAFTFNLWENASAQSQDADETIHIKRIEKDGVRAFRFDKESVTIRKDGTIKWISDEGRHILKAKNPENAFPTTDEFKATESRTLKFENAVEIDYICTNHPGTMKGKITVTEPRKAP